MRKILHMPARSDEPLPRREREAMDLLHRLGESGVGQVQEQMTGEPSYSAVRAHLRILEEKGHAKHEARGPRYFYSPVVSRAKARRGALKSLVQTFFDGSPEQAVAALIDDSKLGAAELDRLAELIDKARKEGR